MAGAERERARLLDLAVESGFDRDYIYGEGGQSFTTVEDCGNDFLAALADATQTTDDWDDLNAIKTKACGNLNDMMSKGVSDDKGVAVNTRLFRNPDSSSQHTPNNLETPSFSSDDSDFEILDEMDTHCDHSLGIQKKAQSRISEQQSRSSAKSTVTKGINRYESITPISNRERHPIPNAFHQKRESSTKPFVFNGFYYAYWKNRMRVYLQSKGQAIWEVVRAPLVLPEVATPASTSLLANSYKAKNFLYAGLGRQEFDRICHLETAHEIWHTLETYHEGYSQIKQVRQTAFKREYNKFEMRPRESIDDVFTRFNMVLNQLRAVDIEYSQSENVTHLLAAINTKEWEIKVTAIEENVNLSNLTLELLYSKLKTHEIKRVDYPKKENMALVADPLKRTSDGSSESSSGFSLAYLSAIHGEELESIPESELALLVKKFTRAYNNVRNKKRGGSVTCYECGELYHIRANCPKLKGKNNNKKEKATWKKPQGNKPKFDAAKLMKAAHRVLAAFGEQSMSDVDSGSEEDKEEELPQDKKKGKAKDFTGMCFMADSVDVNDIDKNVNMK